MKNNKQRKEQYFIRCESKETGQIVLKVMCGVHAFTYRNHRFFYEHGVVTDALTGMNISYRSDHVEDWRKRVIKEVKKKIENNYEEYLKLVKSYLRKNRVDIIQRNIP